MRIRTSLVSNSSSASFVVSLKAITGEQVVKIQNHFDLIKRGEIVLHGKCDETEFEDYDKWNIWFSGREIHGSTSMDNLPMFDFLLAIGVREEDIRYGD